MTRDRMAATRQIADELIDVRQRGIDRLDIDTRQQPYRHIPGLEALARDYCQTTGDMSLGRVAQVTRLLAGALAGYAHENAAAAAFIRDLLFDPPEQLVPTLPSVRLDRAMEAHANGQDFAAIRRPVFEAFAGFLITFVGGVQAQGQAGAKATEQAVAVIEAAPSETVAETDQERASSLRSPRRVAIATGLIVLVLTGAAIWTAVRSGGEAERSGLTIESSSPTPRPGTASVGPAPAGLTTYPQQQGSLGVNTFNDPYNPSITGVKIPPFAWVEVSCKVYSPVFESFKPDGYLYRIASSPWNNEWYAAANTFMNGETEPPWEIFTDFNVPDC